MEPTHGDYDITDVDGYRDLVNRMKAANSDREWSFILSDYISFGNNKISSNVGIFNLNSATDCPNAQSDENNQTATGVCQVPFESCYAHKAENIYPNSLPYRRRQEFLWDSLDAHTFAAAVVLIKSRKRNDFDVIRFSEAGDFRNNGDIIKVDRIAELLAPYGIDIYTYSASHKLDWSFAQHFTVNQSNSLDNYGDRLYTAVPEAEDIPEGAVQCAYEAGEIKCGDCRMCIDKSAPDVYITLH